MIKEGTGYEKPKAESKVSFSILGKLTDGTIFLPTKTIDLIIGTGEIDHGLNKVYKPITKCIKDMKKGEKCLLKIKPEAAWGAEGSHEKNIPPNAEVHFEIELVELVKDKENWEMNSAEKLEAAKKKREQGNQFYKEDKFKRAIKRYKSAVDCIQHDQSFNDEEKQEAKKLKVPCYLNIAAANLKLKDYRTVIENCNKALEIESTNVKALFRRAQAYIEFKDYDISNQDLKKALERDPDNKEIIRELHRVHQLQAAQDRRDKAFYSKMLQGLSIEEEKIEKIEKKEEAPSNTTTS